ncbi:MAG: hypothetical protein HPY68_08195 [Candidatus Atribacteria bacterium]|nr:hypothetical protein [Candidatus Atribacteria bacterium]
MLRTLTLVEKSRVVKSHEIQDFQQGRDFYYLKLKIVLIDESELYVREYVSENEYLYSYHWQYRDGKLRTRWDNAPHHRDLKTFPHHKHIPELAESGEITVEDVLRVIEQELGPGR